MLYIILMVLFLAIVFYGWGSLTRKLLNPNNFISLTLIKGLLVIGLIAFICSFFIPLNLYFEFFILGVGFVLAIYHKFWKIINISIKSDYPYILLFFTSALVASMNPYLFDTFSYYLPTIKWLDQYGLVKGLVNFDFNLGQQSFWHITQASFNETVDIYYKLNAALVGIFILYIKESKKVLLAFFIPILYQFIASSSQDLPIMILSCIIIINFLQKKDLNSVLFGFVISSFLILIKPIAFALFLFFGYLFVIEKCSRKKIITFLFCSVLGFLFLLKNYIISGNLIFPLSSNYLVSPIHSAPNELYENSKIAGRFITMDLVKLNYTFEEFKTWTDKDFFWYIFTNPSPNITIYFFLITLHIILLIYSIVKKNKLFLILAICLLFRALVLLYISPQSRFLIDNFIIIICVLFFQCKPIPIKYISFLITLSSTMFLFNLNFIKQNIHIAPFKNIDIYKQKNLIKPSNYGVNTKTFTFYNFKSNFCTNYYSSVDAKQPALNVSLFNRYLTYSGFHPQAIDSTNVGKGFISVKNDSMSIKIMNFYIDKYIEEKQQHSD